MFSVVPSVCLSVTIHPTHCVDTGHHLCPLANQIKIGRSSTTTDKTSLLQTKTHDISFDKSLLLQCGGIHGHYVPLVLRRDYNFLVMDVITSYYSAAAPTTCT